MSNRKIDPELEPELLPRNGTSICTDLPNEAVPGLHFSRLGTEIVTVHVGPNYKPFTVHKDLLTSQSPVLDNMFGGDFRASCPQCAVLPQDNPATFELFLRWLYSGEIANTAASIPANFAGLNGRAVTADEVRTSTDLIELFCLAERYGIVRLQDQCMDALVGYQRVLNFAPYPAHIAHAYNCSREGSRLRLYLSRFWVFVTLTWVEGVPEAWNAESLSYVIRDVHDIWIDTYKLTRGTTGASAVDPRLSPLCDYHQHSHDQACPYEKKQAWNMGEGCEGQSRQSEGLAQWLS